MIAKPAKPVLRPMAASDSAPFIIADNIPSWGIAHGIAAVTIESVRFGIGPDGPVKELTVTGHLRMSMTTLRQLKDVIEEIEHMAELEKQKPEGPTN